MGDKIALYAKAPRPHEAILMGTVAALSSAAGIAGAIVVATEGLPQSADSPVERALLTVISMLPLLVGAALLWELAKASGRVLPLAWIEVSGQNVRLITPALRGLTMRGGLRLDQALAADFGEYYIGYASAWRLDFGSVRHTFTLKQSGGRARCSGLMPVSDESFEHARRMLKAHGCALFRRARH